MTEIVPLKLKTARPDRLTVAIVVNLSSVRYHISRLIYTKKGLYNVPLTYTAAASPIDVHDSYHPNGEAHGKLTRGVLKVFPCGQALGQAKPHTKDREVVLWQRRGQSWASLKGVERIGPFQTGVQSFVNIEAMGAGYPIFGGSDDDYVFEIESQPLPSKMIDIAVYLCASGNVQALEEELCQNKVRWEIPPALVTVERAELFTNLNPWLAIVLFWKKDS